jgi:hypothetical protein
MRWKIQIEGDKKYLDDLSNIFSALNFDPKIYKDAGNYYLESSIFESLGDAKEVSAIATTFLALVPVVFNFKTERVIAPPKLLKISYRGEKEERVYDSEGNIESSVEISENGKRSTRMYVGSGTFKITGNAVYLATSKDGQFLGGLTTIESIKDYLKTNSDSGALENVAKYLKPSLEKLVNFSSKFPNETPTKDIVKAELEYGTNIELAKWVTLRKIYETIRDDKYFANTKFTNGINFIYDAIGEESAGNFYRTASNKQVHSETTTAKKEYKQPNHEMPLSKAEDLISTLLSKYIEEKVKGGAI